MSELATIPGGEFLMGSSKGEDSPVHRVSLDGFEIDRHEVTNAQYLAFCQATDHRLPFFWGMDGLRCGPDYPDHPVVGVSWVDAKSYAEWRGQRLPTEAEWEYAARGGLEGLHYPNGDTLTPADGNYARSEKRGPIAVASYPPNGFGLHDVLGNVAEWVSDWYDPGACATGPVHNPQGPDAGKFKVIRGGGWHSGPSCSTVHFRNALPPGWLDFNVGFRCAKDVK